MPTQESNQVQEAPFVAPVFKGDLKQWTKDLARELEIRLKFFAHAINRGSLGRTSSSDEALQYALTFGGAPVDKAAQLRPSVEALMFGASQVRDRYDELLTRQFMGI